MPDTIVMATDAGGAVAFTAAVTTQLVAEIRNRHDLWPTATAAVGRLTTGAALLGASIERGERISLQLAGSGPMQMTAADAWPLEDGSIGARGYARNGQVELPMDARGKFNVAAAVGTGTLCVTRSDSAGQPYAGVVPIVSGEIAEDLAAYLAQSEQIPSVVALGVLANPSGVAAAGGVLAQVLPGADEGIVAEIEARARSIPPITRQIVQGAQADALLRSLAGERGLRVQRTLSVVFACRCTLAKVEALLRAVSHTELAALSRDRETIEATCDYCKKRYSFTAEAIARLARRGRSGASRPKRSPPR